MSSSPSTKRYFLRHRRKLEEKEEEIEKISSLKPISSRKTNDIPDILRKKSDRFVVNRPNVKERVHESLRIDAKRRAEENGASGVQASLLESGSPRFDSISNNTFRSTKGTQMEGLLLFQEQPRQVFFLFLMVAVVSYYSFTHDSDDLSTNVRNGLSAAVLIFLVYCFLQTRDGMLVRPHPGIWRIVHGCSVVYLLMLACLSVQNVHGARAALKLLFPEVGSLQKGPYKLDCEINADTVYRGVSSIWFLAHTAGWWGKMCMFRDWRMCWVLSIAFEILECALQFAIPDFQECWWDSIFMDMFGANMVGMCLGRLTLRWFESKEYDWSGKRGHKIGYLRRVVSQFTPISWSQYHWEVFSSFTRFAQILFAIIICLLVELNAFFLLNVLSIPKESNFNSYRLVLVFLVGIPAAAEYYEFLSNPDCWRLGQNSWMLLSIAIFEVLLWLKFSANGILFTEPPPDEVLYPIVAFLSMFTVWMLLFFSRPRPILTPQHTPRQAHETFAASPSKQEKVVSWGTLDILFWLSFTPLLYLTKQWAY